MQVASGKTYKALYLCLTRNLTSAAKHLLVRDRFVRTSEDGGVSTVRPHRELPALFEGRTGAGHTDA